MNLQLPTGMIYNLQMGSEVVAVILDSLAARPYGQVAPIMEQLLNEINRQNLVAQGATKGNGADPLPAPEGVQ